MINTLDNLDKVSRFCLFWVAIVTKKNTSKAVVSPSTMTSIPEVPKCTASQLSQYLRFGHPGLDLFVVQSLWAKNVDGAAFLGLDTKSLSLPMGPRLALLNVQKIGMLLN